MDRFVIRVEKRFESSHFEAPGRAPTVMTTCWASTGSPDS